MLQTNFVENNLVLNANKTFTSLQNNDYKFNITYNQLPAVLTNYSLDGLYGKALIVLDANLSLIQEIIPIKNCTDLVSKKLDNLQNIIPDEIFNSCLCFARDDSYDDNEFFEIIPSITFNNFLIYATQFKVLKCIYFNETHATIIEKYSELPIWFEFEKMLIQEISQKDFNSIVFAKLVNNYRSLKL